MDVPAEPNGVAGESNDVDSVVDPCKLAVKLRFLLTLVTLTILQYGSVGPSTQYITLNFFALQEASVSASANTTLNDSGLAASARLPDCEAAPSSQPCRAAASDATFLTGITGALSKSVAWLLALTLGGYSDSVGRRPIFQAKNTLSLLPTTALALHVFFGASLWGYLVIGPIYEMFDINGVFLALLTDVVTSPKERAKAFANFIAMVVGIAAVVIPIAGLVPMNVAVGISLAAAIAKVVFIFTCFPETAPLLQKIEGQKTGLLSTGRLACGVLRRNTVMQRMAAVLVVSGLASAGMVTINSGYYTAYMGMKRSETAGLFVVCGLSLAFTFACISGPLTRRLGDVRTLQFALAVSVISPLGIAACAEKWQLFVVSFIVFGPSFLQVPLITAIKSNLVGEHEQGLVQGALASVRVIAVAIADAFFGWFYREATDRGKATSKSAALGPYLLVAFLSLCALGIACTLPLVMPPPEPSPLGSFPLGSGEEDHNSTKEAKVGGARELELVSLKDNQAIGA